MRLFLAAMFYRPAFVVYIIRNCATKMSFFAKKGLLRKINGNGTNAGSHLSGRDLKLYHVCKMD